jgi:hypothetical protein
MKIFYKDLRGKLSEEFMAIETRKGMEDKK